MPPLEQLPIVLNGDLLRETSSRDPFDDLAVEMLARAETMVEQIVAGIQRATADDGLDLDQAVFGGLLVRLMKLLRGILDSVQAVESEAHLILCRSAAETAITLAWLVRHRERDSLRRFRADSFAYWRQQKERMAATDGEEDGVSQSVRKRVENHLDHELAAAGLSWDDVPRHSNSWGPDMRQRCEHLGLDWIYPAFFASHSSYVHPSWHELRTFDLAEDGMRVSLDTTFGSIAPIAGYILTRLAVEACQAATEALPCEIDATDVARRVADTVEGSRVLSLHFSAFVARGGIDDELHGMVLSQD